MTFGYFNKKMLIFFPVFKKFFAFKVILHRCDLLTVRHYELEMLGSLKD